jgi:hypothetical protein
MPNSDATSLGQVPQPARPVLSANVPQQISYSGQNYIELLLRPGSFAASAKRSLDGGQS